MCRQGPWALHQLTEIAARGSTCARTSQSGTGLGLAPSLLHARSHVSLTHTHMYRFVMQECPRTAQPVADTPRRPTQQSRTLLHAQPGHYDSKQNWHAASAIRVLCICVQPHGMLFPPRIYYIGVECSAQQPWLYVTRKDDVDQLDLHVVPGIILQNATQ